MNEQKRFKDIIKDWLDNKAGNDPLFATTYAKPNKNLDECCAYIIEEARKVKDGTVAVMDSDAVFSLAVHYYDEDSIQVKNKKPAVQKVATTQSQPAVQKKEEEKKNQIGRQLTIFDVLGE